MSNMLLKTIIRMSSETGSTELPKGSGTKSDPYNWYKILDSNNPNGCHTEWINQNSEEGWIKVKLEGGVTYSIGQSYYDENGNSFDGYFYVYDSNFNSLSGVDGTSVTEIDGFTQLDASDYFTPNETGYYYIKAASYNNNYPDRKVTIHCQPAPINDSGSGGGTGGGNLIEADENCYVIEVKINDTASPIRINDEGSNHGVSPTIDWGDGTLVENDLNTSFEHYYNEPGTYKIIWRNGYSEGTNSFEAINSNYITNISQLSYNRNDWNSLFERCNFDDDVTINFGNPPSSITSVNQMFANTTCNTIRIVSDQNVILDFGGFFRDSTIKYFYASDYLFGGKNDLYVIMHSAFSDCTQLIGFYDEKGVNGGFIHYNGNFNYMFRNCYNLYLGDGDWNNIRWIFHWATYTNSSMGVTRSVRQMFDQCYSLIGTVEPRAFWNHYEVNQIYTDYTSCFTQTKINNLNDAKSNGWA